MGDSDRLLVGIDLRKTPSTLERAYDDPAGVTARFNRNILARINRELGGEFRPGAFRHHARYLEEPGRIEIYLVSSRPQQVRIRESRLEVAFARDEAVHTEDSYKYSLEEIDTLAAAAGLASVGRWLDSARRFSVNLFAPDRRRSSSGTTAPMTRA